MPWRSQIRMIWWARAVRSCARPGQRRRDPQQPPSRVRHHLHVHPVSAVPRGEIGPAAAHPVAFDEGAVEQNVVRLRLAQSAQQGGRSVGEQVDDGCRRGVVGADSDAEASSELGEGVVSAQVRQADQCTLVRWELAAAVTLAGDDEHGHPGGQGCPSWRWLPCFISDPLLVRPDIPVDMPVEAAP